MASIQASPEALQQALSALRQLGASVAANRGRGRSQVSSSLDSLAEAKARASARLEATEGLLSSVRSAEVPEGQSPPDTTGLEAELSKVREKLSQLKLLESQGVSLLREVETNENRAMRLADSAVVEAKVFVQDSLERLRDFQAFRPEASNVSGRASVSPRGEGFGGGGTTHSQDEPVVPSSKPPSTLELVSTVLPEGFAWVPVDKLVQSKDYREEELHFEKSSPEELRELLGRFRERVIPVLGVHGNNTPAELEKLDMAEQCYGAKSLHNTYSKFVNREGDTIAVSRKHNSIESGRHRIWAAKEMGWSHIPARILD